MKITRNTTPYATRDLRRIICRVHAHMTKLEGRKAPRWNRLVIHIEGRGRNRLTGHAFFNGAGYVNGWDVFFTIPRDGLRERRFGWLVYHELMHTYGYNHGQYSNIPQAELEQLFPDNNPIALATPKTPKPVDKVKQRYESMLRRRKAWHSKKERATNALAKVEREIRAYERRHGDRVTG